MAGAGFPIIPYSFETTEHYVSLRVDDQYLSFFPNRIDGKVIEMNMQGHHVVFLGPIFGEKITIRCKTMLVLNSIKANTDIDIFANGYLFNFGNLSFGLIL